MFDEYRIKDFFQQITMGKVAIISIILALQALSWTTSVKGAEIILPNLYLLELGMIKIPASFLLGSIIQGLLLFLFFFGRQEIKSSFYRRTLLLLLTVASIYTSFFITYKLLSEDQKTGVTFEKGSEQVELYKSVKNSVLQSPTYQESTQKLSQLEILNKNLSEQIKRVGKDPEYLRKEKERDNLLKENPQLKAVEKIQKLVDNDKNIGDVDNVLSSLTSEIRYEVYESVTAKKVDKNSSINKLNEEILSKLKKETGYSESGYFLIPFEEVLKGNNNAILALGIASFIDIVSFIFGVSLNKKSTDRNMREKLKSLSRLIKDLLKSFLPNLIKEIGHTLYIFIASLGSLTNGIFKGFIVFRVRALQVFYYIPYTIKIRGDRHEFLHNIWESIEFAWDEDINTKFNSLNYTKLMTLAQYNQSYKVGYKKIIVTMCDLQWLKIISGEDSGEDKKLIIKEYKKLDEWYHSEYSKQFGAEKNTMLEADDYHHIIRLPEDKKENIGRLGWWFRKQFKKLLFAIRQIFTG
jgi:hypothetical protein